MSDLEYLGKYLEIEFLEQLRKCLQDPKYINKAVIDRYKSASDLPDEFINWESYIDENGNISANAPTWLLRNKIRVMKFAQDLTLKSTFNKQLFVLDALYSSIGADLYLQFNTELVKGIEEEMTGDNQYLQRVNLLNQTYQRALVPISHSIENMEVDSDKIIPDSFKNVIDEEIHIRKHYFEELDRKLARNFWFNNGFELNVIGLMLVSGTLIGFLLTLTGALTPFGLSVLGLMSMTMVGFGTGCATSVPFLLKIHHKQICLENYRSYKDSLGVMSNKEVIKAASSLAAIFPIPRSPVERGKTQKFTLRSRSFISSDEKKVKAPVFLSVKNSR